MPLQWRLGNRGNLPASGGRRRRRRVRRPHDADEPPGASRMRGWAATPCRSACGISRPIRCSASAMPASWATLASPRNVGGAAACRGVVKGTDWMAPGCGSAPGEDFPGGSTWTELTAATLRKPGTRRRNRPPCQRPGHGDPATVGTSSARYRQVGRAKLRALPERPLMQRLAWSVMAGWQGFIRRDCGGPCHKSRTSVSSILIRWPTCRSTASTRARFR